MKAELFIWLGHNEAQPVRWMRRQRKHTAPAHTGKLPGASTLSELQDKARDAVVWLLVPGEHCVHLPVTLPNHSKQARRSIPYLIEEKLCQPLEETHVAYLPGGQSNNYDVIAVATAQMRAWLDALSSAGIAPDYVVPDFMVLPHPGEELHLLQDGSRTLARGDRIAATLNSDTLSAWLKLSGKEHPTSHSYGEVPPAGLETTQQEMIDPLAQLANLAANSKPLNLLQGEYAERNPFSDYMQLLKLPMAAAFLFALLNVVHAYIEIQTLDKQKHAYQQAIEQVFRSALPETRRIVNPRSQMKARLATLETQADSGAFLALLEKLSLAAALHNSVEIQSLRFDAIQNTLQLQVIANDFASLEKLNDTLQQQALTVDPGAYQQTSTQQVSAQLTIREGDDV